MATPGTMDDSFRSRVERVFGSLTTGRPQPPSPNTATSTSSESSSLWSLTDDQVEKKDWKKGRAGLAASAAADRDELPCSLSFAETRPSRSRDRRRRAMFGSDDDEEEEEEEEEDGDGRRCSGGDDVWEIKSSIGMDRTLDNEEEEDEYDKVAEGREDAGDRLYMKNVMDGGSYSTVPRVIRRGHGIRDPRANRLAAKIRLQEDKYEALKLKPDLGSNKEVKELYDQPAGDAGRPVRPILKRKDSNSDVKSNKRVRFDPNCRISSEEDASERAQDTYVETAPMDAMVSDSRVPDYIRNPSKYTRYTFDSSNEMDEKSNTNAYLDFLELIKGSKSGTGDGSGGLPKCVTFIPRKKAGDFKIETPSTEVKQDDNGNQSSHQAGLASALAAEESIRSDGGAMEEDEKEIRTADQVFQKPARRYRTKSSLEETD